MALIWSRLSLIIFALGAGLTFASVTQARVGDSWTEIPARLKTLGIQKIGDLEINQLLEEGQVIQWRENPNLPPEKFTGNRRSAYYMTSTQEVYISPVAATQAKKSLAHLELHEAMGALGYHDEDTSLSTALDVISKIEDRGNREQLARQYGSKLFRRGNFRMAGGSSVCGGGDLNALFIKDQIVADLQSIGHGASLDFLVAYPRLNIEPVYLAAMKSISVQYKYANHEESLGIYIPMARWQLGPQEQHRMLEEIRNDILQLIPQNGKFPEARDPGAREVQIFRTRMISHDGSIADEFKMTFPALPFGTAPEDAEHRFYKCTWSLGQRSMSQDLEFKRGSPTTVVMTGACPGVSFAFLSVVSDAQAGIAGLSLDCGKDRFQTHSLSISEQVSGTSIRTQCVEIFPRK